METSTAFRRSLGYSPEELEHRSFASLFCAPERLGELPEAQSVLAANQGEYQAEAHLQQKSGALLPVRLLYKNLGDERPIYANGNAPGTKQPFSSPMWVLVFELSRETETERLLADYQSKFELFAQRKQEFIGSLDQRLRVWLAEMSAAAALLKGKAGTEKTGGGKTSGAKVPAEALRQVEEGIAACRKILDDALAPGGLEGVSVVSGVAERKPAGKREASLRGKGR